MVMGSAGIEDTHQLWPDRCHHRRDFSYDALGNLLSKDGLSYRYDGSGGPHAASQTLAEAPSYIFSNGFENTPYVMAPRAGSSTYRKLPH